jgi:HEAT repeat protein
MSIRKNRIYCKRSLAIMLTLVTGACGTPAHSAGHQRQIPDHIQALLSAEEYVPTAKDVERLGDDAPHVLMSVASDGAADPIHRARALALLQFYPAQQDVSQFLVDFIRLQDQSQPLFRTALISFASMKKAEAVSTISPYLSSDNIQVREAAAQALAATQSATAADMLESTAHGEKEPFLREEMRMLSTEIRTKQGTSTEKATSRTKQLK